MRRPDSFQAQQGYFTFVQNNATTNYLELAYLQAKSIKETQRINNYAIAVDQKTQDLITERHRAVFDYVILIPGNDEAAQDEIKWANEWKAWWITPFKETVKLDCDILFSRDISHWWQLMQKREVCIATSARDYHGNVATSRAYRKLFDENNLIDAYSGFTYFRFSVESMEFFKLVKEVYHNWPLFRDTILHNCRDEQCSTDVAYAIAAKLYGEDQCYLPSNIQSFVHMKGAINGFATDADWTQKLYYESDKRSITVGFNRQLYPFHYVNKEFGEKLAEHVW